MIIAYSLLYLLAGIIGGLIVGFIGTGSSIVILPMLNIIFFTIFPKAIAIKLAIGTCMMTIAIGAIVGAIIYKKLGLINKSIFYVALPFCFMGSIIGPVISNFLSANILPIYIGSFILLTAVYKLIKSFLHDQEIKETLSWAIIICTVFIAATLSSIAGVAIGIILMPVLDRYLPHREVVATNLAIAACYAPFAAITYLILGILNPVNIHYTLGYVYLPALIFLSIGTLIFTPIGIKISYKLSAPIIKRIFYLALIMMGLVILTH
ncbi:MAG: hypothetical protein A3E87_10745 [Gammaproteobacteria bacterium RIFCSPHIGHO2_12_FULL_35_23]|nr:MAG: hypothetical protein A3E87_10745 [Gammaproteobacteria bacterium RIFCSPHIGHO2_12_FULL_35_23]